LEWEENEKGERGDGGTPLFGVLNFYIVRGVKPAIDKNTSRLRPSIGSKPFEDYPPPQPKHDVKVRIVDGDDSDDLVSRAMDIVNNEYAMSDTGTTLSSARLRLKDVQRMVRDRELMVAEDELTGELVGCVQVSIKREDRGTGGLPNFGDGEAGKYGEFTCLAVRSEVTATVKNANTRNVTVVKSPAPSGTGRRGRGIGAALVRAAEAYCRRRGCSRMQLAILTPAKVEVEPEFKQWLRTYYQGLGYTHRSTIDLGFEMDEEGMIIGDEVHEMYEVLHQLVQCKAVLFDKRL